MGDYDWGFVLFVTLIFVVVLPVYLSPALIAYTRRHPRRWVIAGLNLILGGAIIAVIFGPYWIVDTLWTVAFVAWVLLLLWAFLPAGRVAEGKDAVPQLPAWRRRLSIIIGVFVLGVIGMILAIPHFLRTGSAASEASAVGSTRLIMNCLVSYQSGHPDIGYPAAVGDLGPVSGGGDGCIDAVLTAAASGGAPKSMYKFVYTAGPVAADGIRRNFTVVATPHECKEAGAFMPEHVRTVRTYFIDETGILRFTNLH